MQQILDLRGDSKTAACISHALRLQALFGHERASSHLKAHGVEPALALRVLAVRYERRRNQVGLQGIAEASSDWGLAVRLP